MHPDKRVPVGDTVDLRPRNEFRVGHFDSAVSIPLDTLAGSLYLLSDRKQRLWLFGNDDEIRTAREILRAKGYQKIETHPAAEAYASPRESVEAAWVGGDERVRLWQAAPFLRETALRETFLNERSLEGASVLDVASGSGRESVWLALAGARVVGVDRLRDATKNAERLSRQTLKALETRRDVALEARRDGGLEARRDAALDQTAHAAAPFAPPRWVEANVERDWPFTGDTFDILLCFRFLWRPLLPTLVATLRPGGSLVYQSFTEKQREFGRPKRDIHLFKEGELRSLFEQLGLETQLYEGTCPPGGPAMASLWARKR